MTTIRQTIAQYLAVVASSRSPRTERAYRNGLNAFCDALRKARLDPDTLDVSSLSEDAITILIRFLKEKSPSTESQYIAAASGFYHYLAAERLASVNLPRLKELVKQRSRKQGRRLPQFPRKEIETLIVYANNLATAPVGEEASARAGSEKARAAEHRRARLRNLRDRAFILFLADTGLRVDEACSLASGDVDFLEGRLTVVGKGDDQAVVRISERALAALKDYLALRKEESDAAGAKAKSLPLFTRHDRGAKRNLTRMTTQTGWNIVKARAREAVGEAADQIHPHSFRHYFVTVVLLATRNIEIARRLARHKSISVTQRYAEVDPELDEEYYQIFNNKDNR